MKSCLIVDDVPDAQRHLATAIGTVFPGIAVALAHSLTSARQWLATHPAPDLALIDLGLPDGSGVALIEELSNGAPQTVCVVASVFDDDLHIFPALRAGAQGYLLKDQDWREIGDLLTGIVSGRPPLSPAIARKVLAHFHPAQPVPASPASAGSKERADLPLTARETEVLGFIAKGLTMAEAAKLMGISQHTVSSYVKGIYRKLNVGSRAEAALAARNLGLA